MSTTAPRLRMLLVDDHALFREGLARLLGAEPDLEVTAHCATAAEGLAALARETIDLVLLDVDLGPERGIDFLMAARQQGFAGPVLLVTAGVSELEASLLVSRGAAGVFHKQDSAQLLAQAIRAVAEGRAWIDQRSLASMVNARQRTVDQAASLTSREREVLSGVFDGLANKEIAARLGLSESSVKAALQQLFDKAGVRTRSQLVRVALERFPREP